MQAFGLVTHFSSCFGGGTVIHYSSNRRIYSANFGPKDCMQVGRAPEFRLSGYADNAVSSTTDNRHQTVSLSDNFFFFGRGPLPAPCCQP